MNLNYVKESIGKYINKAFVLYQDDYELEVNFSNWLSILFKWDQNEEINLVSIESIHGSYEGESIDHINYALEFIKVNSEIIMKYKQV